MDKSSYQKCLLVLFTLSFSLSSGEDHKFTSFRTWNLINFKFLLTTPMNDSELKLLMILLVYAIRCYQCSSQTDQKGVDKCGAYEWFNKTEHIPIECNSDESHMPGSFCMKVVQQGPRGFICKSY